MRADPSPQHQREGGQVARDGRTRLVEKAVVEIAYEFLA